MLRTAGQTSAWMAIVFANCLLYAQEPAAERKAPRAVLPKTLERIRPDARVTVGRSGGMEGSAADPQKPSADRARESARARVKNATPGSPAALAELGASAPFDYSAEGGHLVAAVRDGDGLALWDTASGKRLRRLEDSDRRYSLVAISDDARWIAAVRHDDGEQIDLWRADTCRHARIIRAAQGAKSKLEFTANNQLRVLSANGDVVVFSIPAGVVVGGSQGRQGGSAAARPGRRVESPKSAMPSAPSTSRVAPRAQPPVAVEPEGAT